MTMIVTLANSAGQPFDAEIPILVLVEEERAVNVYAVCVGPADDQVIRHVVASDVAAAVEYVEAFYGAAVRKVMRLNGDHDVIIVKSGDGDD